MGMFGKVKRISDDRLLPCPFCGEDAEIVIYKKDDGSRDRIYVGCTTENCCEFENVFYDIDKCIAAWNTRRLVKEDGQWVIN